MKSFVRNKRPNSHLKFTRNACAPSVYMVCTCSYFVSNQLDYCQVRVRGQAMYRRSVSCAVLYVSLLQICEAYVPAEYILEVSAECGERDSPDARVKVLTDLPNPEVHAVCLNESEHHFFRDDSAHFQLPVFYNSTRDQCVFKAHPVNGVFKIAVFVEWGTDKGQVQMHEERYWVSCMHHEKSNGSSAEKQIVESVISPQEIQTHVGNRSTSTFKLRMTDILGNDLLQPIDTGKMVKIVATSDGSGGEVGLRAVACDAFGANNNSFAILRAGCGDGMILGKESGFVTAGLVSTSPYFPTFRLFADSNLTFNCNFTLCDTNCDGSSCTAVTKRSTQHSVPEMISLSSEVLLVQSGITFSTASLPSISRSCAEHASQHSIVWDLLLLAVISLIAVIGLVLIGRSLVLAGRNEEPVFTVMKP